MPCPRARARQGRLPPVLRRAGPDGRPADAAHDLTPPVPAPPSDADAAPERDGAPARARTSPDGPETATFRHTFALRLAPETPESGVGTPADAPKAGHGRRNRDNCARGSHVKEFPALNAETGLNVPQTFA